MRLCCAYSFCLRILGFLNVYVMCLYDVFQIEKLLISLCARNEAVSSYIVFKKIEMSWTHYCCWRFLLPPYSVDFDQFSVKRLLLEIKWPCSPKLGIYYSWFLLVPNYLVISKFFEIRRPLADFDLDWIEW